MLNKFKMLYQKEHNYSRKLLARLYEAQTSIDALIVANDMLKEELAGIERERDHYKDESTRWHDISVSVDRARLLAVTERDALRRELDSL